MFNPVLIICKKPVGEKNYLEETIRFLLSNGITVHTIECMKGEKGSINLAKEAELIVVIGGDGSFLQVIHSIEDPSEKIFLPVRAKGSLGFLSATDYTTLPDFIRSIYTSMRFGIELHRRIKVYRDSEFLGSFLNEIVIKPKQIQNTIRINLKINDTFFGTIKADGLIISTPTGSTAYNLSEAGFIALLNAENMVITPLAPLSRFNIPIITNINSKVVVEVLQESVLIGDGHLLYPLAKHEEIIVKKGDTIKIIKVFNDLLKKLKRRMEYDI